MDFTYRQSLPRRHYLYIASSSYACCSGDSFPFPFRYRLGGTMRKPGLLFLVPIAFAFAAPVCADNKHHTPPPPVSCAELATDPANDLAGNPSVKSATSQITPAAGANVAFCQVNILFGTNPNQNINIVVGLPLNARDGGTGGVQGAWNGRTQGIGGGGCLGNLVVNSAV